MNERQVPGYPDYVVRQDGTIYNTKHKRIVKGKRNGVVTLYDAQGYPKQFMTAHVIAEAFGRPRPNSRAKIQYRDGNRNNLVPDNLFWPHGISGCVQCHRPINSTTYKQLDKLHPTLCWQCCGMTTKGRVPNIQTKWPCPLCK